MKHLIEVIKEWHKRRNDKRIWHRKMHLEFHKHMDELYRQNGEVHRYYKHMKYSYSTIIFLSLALGIFVFKYFGIRMISIIFAAIISIVVIVELIFLMTMEKRVFKPISKLENGVEEISKGNYDVEIEFKIHNEIGMLIYSFNDMAKKLKQAEKVKKEYEESRKNLIASISHDLKTPITSIQGYIETLQEMDNAPKETVKKYHQIIYNNTAYINRLIDDLFLFSKLDIQKLDFNFERAEMKAFMEDLMQEFSFALEDKGVKFNYTDSIDKKSYVKIDGKRVNQIFRNLIGNAVKYGDDKDLLIEVALYRENNMIYTTVKDNGPGIPKEKLQHIFERFYRIDCERTKDLMSTGLGLAIAKELVEAQGGEIKVSSVVNEGTCFTIMFPVLE
ncbi:MULTISPECIES: sensor histidine kinase [Clostridium]|uniref:sensor histidine kinase n=1 Tax=Clostridium TaxID=1485 RepID=UPI000826F771|nr:MULTISPECIES: HAMP domain-containing sensor histidine kinase [Clostridium]PJI07533.1 sensor histidine kinase [Clostridium sp. CT7]